MSEEEKVTKGRGPGYPYIALDKVLERVQQVYDAGVREKAFAPQTYYSTWDLGAKSSASRQTMAALNHFGMVIYEGKGKSRKVGLSDLALKIVQDKRPNSVDRANAIKKAALEPNVHAGLYKQFPPPMPEDVFITHVLVSEYGYNESTAESVLKGYKQTLSFANLDKPDSMPASDSDKADEIDANLDGESSQIEIGDLIQGTVGGLDVFPKGARVLGFSDDRQWIFHDFSNSPLEIKDASIMEKAQIPTAVPPVMPASLLTSVSAPPPVQRDSSVLTSGKLKSGTFEVRTTGEMSAKDIGRIIKMLKAQKMILTDDEEDDDEDA